MNFAGEAVDVFRKLGGAVYAPNTDPRTGWNDPTGYATDRSGVWQEERHVPFVHVLDMGERVAGEYWMVGSANTLDGAAFGGATASRSTDAGKTWQLVRQETYAKESDRNGFERYYWTKAVNGKMVMQAAGVVNAPLRVFDGNQWSTVRLPKDWTNGWQGMDAVSLCSTYSPKLVEEINGTLVCPGYSYFTTDRGSIVNFDGKTAKKNIGGWPSNTGRITLPGGGYTLPSITDWHKADDGWLYALSSQRGVARTQDGVRFQVVLEGAVDARTLAVANGNLYFAGAEGNIYKADKTVNELVGANGAWVEPTLAKGKGGGKGKR